jgi:hypothetical protein
MNVTADQYGLIRGTRAHTARGHLGRLYDPGVFSIATVVGATSIAVLSFPGFLN